MKHTNDQAVSPVIGVILMVAITVILAAVIAAFVFGMANNIQKTKVVAATAQQPDAKTIIVTYQGGQDASSCTNITATVTSSSGITTEKGVVLASGQTTVPVGSALSFSGEYAGKDHVVVIAGFTDGDSQVILDNTI